MNATEYYDSIKEDRAVWRAQFSRCMYCGDSDILEVHEIARRSAATRSWGDPSNYLLLCGAMSRNNCHEKRFATMPAARQLAVKLIRDPWSYSLVDWLRIQDPELKAPDRVTQEEVDREAVIVREIFNEMSGMKF